MARTIGATNKPKEVLYTHTCQNCDFRAKTCIPNATIGHICANYNPRKVKKGK